MLFRSETELRDKVTTVCKNIVAKGAAPARESTWQALVDYWASRGGNYIDAVNKAANDAGIAH